MSADGLNDMDVSDAGGTSSDSDSDFEEVDASPEDMDLMMKLESDLQANPNLYDSHIQYVGVLRKCKLCEKLRAAREAMHERYPLTEQLWLEWLQDEIASADSAASREQIEQLFQKAVQDYLSVPVWKAYMEFVEGSVTDQTGNSSSIKHFRDVCEQALTAAGLHITLGSSLWNTYRDYEAQLAASDPTADAQQQRVRQLYHRQLQVPLADGAKSLQSYRAWEAKLAGATQPAQVPGHVEQGFQKAQQTVSVRHEHEAMVAPDKVADENLLAAFLAYIKFEEAKANPAGVRLLYERALAAFPVTTYLWQAYAYYMQDCIKVPAAVNSVYTRALRNCPWVGSLWGNALRALELHTTLQKDQHDVLYSSALQAGLQTAEDYMEVILARLDGLRHMGTDHAHALRQGFQQAAELMQTYFPDYIDRSLRLQAYWADCEMRLDVGGPSAAQAVWEEALKGSLGRYVEPSIAYATMLAGGNHHDQARRVFKRGYTRNFEENGRAFLCEAWLRFEREHGTAQTFAEASCKVRPFLEQAAAAAAAAADAQGNAKAQAAAKKAKRLTPEEMKKMRQQADPNYQAKQAAAGNAASVADADAPLKKGKKGKAPASNPELSAEAPTKASAAPAAQEHASQDVKLEALAAGTHGAAQEAAQVQADNAAASGSKRRHGLGFAEEQPQSKRPKQTPPAPLGFSHPDPVHSPQQASAASIPQQQASGKPAVGEASSGSAVSGDRPAASAAAAGSPAQQQGSAAAQGPPVVFTDECTAFVRGLDNMVTEAELRELLAPCGEVKDVRMVMDKVTGRPKGFGYVQFGNNGALQKAVELKEAELHGRKISIMVSKPPSSGAAGRGAGRGRGGPGRGFGGGRGDRGRSIHQHERLAVSAAPAFVPRAIAKKEDAANAASTSTNADFRKLLKKK